MLIKEHFRACVAVFLTIVLMITAEAVMQFDFSCTGDAATLSSYSYMKEQSLEASGYTRGLRSGSINYLENGKISKFEERYTHDPGNSTPKGNSSLHHEMKVDFEGDKSISEFYGQGFFKNNRAYSAWKKIRYDIIRKNVTDLQGNVILSTRTATKIIVDANLDMDMAPGAEYDIKYNAKIWDGVIETRDSASWTNKTVANRLDWEHSTLSRGDFLNIHNNLSEYDLYYTAAPPGEWLPCCYDGANPLNENIVGKRSVIAPDKILPQVNGTCYLTCKNRCIANCSPKKTAIERTKCQSECEKACSADCRNSCTNLSCNKGTCSGFDCIYTYDSEEITSEGLLKLSSSMEISAVVANASQEIVKFSQNGENETAMKVKYSLFIKNDGDFKLSDVKAEISLPKGIMPDKEIMPDRDASFKIDKETVLSNKLGTLLPGDEKKMEFTAFLKGNVDARTIAVIASGKDSSGMNIETSLTRDHIIYPLSSRESGTNIGGGP